MIWLRLRRTVKLAAVSLWMHRLRSTLTTLGIIFGVCSVVAMLAIGEGASQEAQEQIARLGSRNVIVQTVKPPETQRTDTQQARLEEYGLSYLDAERLRDTIPGAQVIVPVRRLVHEGRYRTRKAAIEMLGTLPWYPETHPLDILRGRFLDPLDLRSFHNVCVLDESVYDQLFLFDWPIGAFIKIGGEYYEVVGVARPRGAEIGKEKGGGAGGQGSAAAGGGGVAGRVYLPLTTVRQRFGEMIIQLGTGGQQAERVELQQITVQAPSTESVPGVSKVIEGLLARTHKKKDYQVTVPLELLEQAARTKRIFSVVLGSIAAISLVVGGIGIMNIMLATVSERTREIGIRRALGAKRRDIILQFLSETVLLTTVGGILGIALGFFIPIAVERFAKMPTVITGISLALAFGISGAVGLTFGIYPAYRAANMDPIESLRHE